MRRLLSTTYEIQASVLNHAAAPRDLVEQAERAMLEVAHDDRQKDFRTIDDILDDELKKMEKLSREGTSLTGTPSGFRDLDEITGGFQPGNLIVIAARPSMGKCLKGSTLVYDARSGARRRVGRTRVSSRVRRGGRDRCSRAGPAAARARVSATFATAYDRCSGLQPGSVRPTHSQRSPLTLDGWKRVDELALGARIGVPRTLPRQDSAAHA